MKRAGIAMLLLAAALVCNITNAKAATNTVADGNVITESSSGSVAEQPVAHGAGVPLLAEVLLFVSLSAAATVLLTRRKTDDSMSRRAMY